MSDHVYCTYFDSAYASRGRVLIETLRKHGDYGDVYVLALDSETMTAVSCWTDLGIHVVSVAELERAFPQLVDARAKRSSMEYLFTLTPWLTKWTLGQVPSGGWATYLDADMAFFSSPEPLYTAASDGSVMLIEHRFTWEQTWRHRYGRFNVAWVGFRNDADGIECLQWWADSCLDWCYDQVSHGRFADQGYLDRFPDFPGVVILDSPGADLAPWNLRRHRLSKGESGTVLVDGAPLVFFHFHGLREQDGRYHFKHLPYFARTTSIVRDEIYGPYCRSLEAASAREETPSTRVLNRRPTFASSFDTGRTGLLRWLGKWRGDYVDINPRRMDSW